MLRVSLLFSMLQTPYCSKKENLKLMKYQQVIIYHLNNKINHYKFFYINERNSCRWGSTPWLVAIMRWFMLPSKQYSSTNLAEVLSRNMWCIRTPDPANPNQLRSYILRPGPFAPNKKYPHHAQRPAPPRTVIKIISPGTPGVRK